MSKFSRDLLRYLITGAAVGAAFGGGAGVVNWAINGEVNERTGPGDKEWVEYKREFDSTLKSLEKLGLGILPSGPYTTITPSRPLKLRISLQDGDIIELNRGFLGSGAAVIRLDQYLQIKGTNFPTALKERIMTVEERYPKVIKKYDAFVNAQEKLQEKRAMKFAAAGTGLGVLGGAGAAIYRRRKEMKSLRRTGRR